MQITQFTKKYPAISVQVRDLVAERAIDAVKREEVNFGIGARMKADRNLTVHRGANVSVSPCSTAPVRQRSDGSGPAQSADS
jgi:hypothetical protein